MNFLNIISEAQYNHTKKILFFVLVVAVILGAGIFQISMQSNMDEMMPQDLEIYKIADRVDDNFGRNDASIILLRIEEADKSGIYDIRDPEVMRFLVELQDALSDEDLIEGVQSAGLLFSKDSLPESLDESRIIFNNVPGSSDFFNKDYSATIVMISSDLGGGEGKIKQLESLINEKVSKISRPDGLEVYVTGTPQIRSMILDLLVSDSIFTLSLAAIIILVLLIVMERSINRAFLIFFPLVLGIVLTLGTMGWLGIQLSVVTVGIGAMILGLGVEYGVFIVSRYSEEREKNSSRDALRITVRDVGGSVLGSGMTTVMGFLALTLSMMPVMRDLGFSLALGIAFSLMSAVFVNPALIIFEERIMERIDENRHKNLSKKIDKNARRVK